VVEDAEVCAGVVVADRAVAPQDRRTGLGAVPGAGVGVVVGQADHAVGVHRDRAAAQGDDAVVLHAPGGSARRLHGDDPIAGVSPEVTKDTAVPFEASRSREPIPGHRDRSHLDEIGQTSNAHENR